MSDAPPPVPVNPSEGGSPPIDAKEALQGPAIGLFVTAGIGFLGQLLGLLMNVLGAGLGAATGGEEGMINMLSGGLGIVFNLIGMAVSGLILFGAIKMKNLENYSMAMAGTIVAMIPCISPCCLIGLPVGIWALSILSKPGVKESFKA